ncbi:unnamed protein product, partial [Mesorhabditis belari]|uniref:Sulfotransferase n=1 Tax=Mesorhabditis belari TaxID=2138241 RepID=A0AAF3EKB1_9BILA
MLLLLIFSSFILVTLVEAVKPLGHRFIWSEQYKPGFGLEYCEIPKTGLTITKKMLCDVQKDYKGVPKLFSGPSKLVGFEDECQLIEPFFGKKSASKWRRPARNVRFSLVRDPLERFVSLYVFICKGSIASCPPKAKNNIHQFARWIYGLQRTANSQGKPREGGTNNAFVVFHSWPQTNFCDLKRSRMMIVKVSHDRRKMQRKMLRVFRQAHVPERVAKKALRYFTESSTIHTGRNNGEKRRLLREIRENPLTMQYLHAMYHEDFRYFKTHRFH